MDAQAETKLNNYSQSGELHKSRAEREPARSECNLTEGRCPEEQHGNASKQNQEFDEQAAGRLTGISKRLFSQAAQIREAERALRESHDRLLSIVETANDPIIGADRFGNVIMWNSAATQTFGYTAEEVMNRPITILMPDRFQELHEHAMQRAVAVGRLYYAKRVREVFGRRKDGTEFPVEVSISGWRTQEGMFFTGIVRDITERKKRDEELREAYEGLELRVAERTAELVKVNENLEQEIKERRLVEEMLRDSERLYHTLVEEVPDVIFILDEEGRFSYLNTQAEEFLQMPLRDILETPLASYVAPEDREKIVSISALPFDSIWDEEIRLLDSDGEKKYARIRCKAIGNDGKGKIHYEGVMRDISRRRRLEEQLKESREELLEKIRIIDELYAHIVEAGKARAIAEHTAEVAHELRQPLTIIGGFARRMTRQLDLSDINRVRGQAEAVGIISTEIQRLEKILNTLIDYTRPESVSQQMVDPNHIIEKVLNLYREVIGDKNLRLDVVLRSAVGKIFVDPVRFEQVVRNLISNAIDASPSGAALHVETGISIPSTKALATALKSESYFQLKVRNYGPVIEGEDLQRIFSPFFTTKDYGTGIGLTLAKKIVEAHNGSISVNSEGGETTFTVWLPLNQRESAMRRPA